MAAEKLRDIDPDWECSSTVKRGIIDVLQPYYEILHKRRKNYKELILHFFLMSSETWPEPFSVK